MFFEIFSKVCAEKGLSPSSVVQAIGLNKSNITYWRRGSIPSSKNLQKLADYLQVTTDFLLTGNKPEEVHNKISSPPDKADEDDEIDVQKLNFALSGEVHDLSDEEVQEIVRFAKFMRQQRRLRDQQNKSGGGDKKDG